MHYVLHLDGIHYFVFPTLKQLQTNGPSLLRTLIGIPASKALRCNALRRSRLNNVATQSRSGNISNGAIYKLAINIPSLTPHCARVVYSDHLNLTIRRMHHQKVKMLLSCFVYLVVGNDPQSRIESLWSF